MVSQVTSTSGSSSSSSATSSKISNISAEDFLKIMVKEMQQQDPFEPMSSQELIAQVGQIRDIQSSLDLSSAIKDLSLSQKIGSASSLLGKKVTGLDSNGNKVSGTVKSVCRENDQIYLELDTSQKINITDVVSVIMPTETTSSDTQTTK